jgi:hypothetical protein
MSKTIFVSIASYRDSNCNKTLESLFANASNPERVFVGICEQNKPGEGSEKCIGTNTIKHGSNIKIINVDYTDAKGPTWARYLCSTLWNGEDYFLQVDSHVLFVKDWDTKCIDMMNGIKKKDGVLHPVLSHYTRNMDDYGKPNENREVPKMCQSFFNKRGMLSFLGSHVMRSEPDGYERNPYIAAGFLFAEGSFLQDVPFDPYLDFVFVGEEILLSARAYTSGYDVYGPTEDIVYHLYTRADEPKIWSDKQYSDKVGHEKIRVIMKLKEGDASVYGRYGMGNKRTIEEFYEFAGIDIKNKKILKNFCQVEIDPYFEVQDSVDGEGWKLYKWVWWTVYILIILNILYVIVSIG